MDSSSPPIVNESIELVAVERLEPHPRNPRKGNLEVVRESIRTNGFFGAVVAQKSTGYILAGNHRWQAARDNGMPEVPVCWVDCDEAQAARILLADNRTSDLATYDDGLLVEMLQQLMQEDQGLLGTGYTAEDLADLLGFDSSPGVGPGKENGSLADRFIVPPFSVLDARQGYWQDRKRFWLSFGIRSALGRGDAAPGGGGAGASSCWLAIEDGPREAWKPVAEKGKAQRAKPNACPGGSKRPNPSLGADGKTTR